MVNIGLSRKDFDDLTPLELAFIRKEYETKTVSQSTLMRNAFSNSLTNGFRKKGKAFVELWNPSVTPMEKEEVKDNLQTIREIEEAEKKNGGSWVDLIYKNAGLKRK